MLAVFVGKPSSKGGSVTNRSVRDKRRTRLSVHTAKKPATRAARIEKFVAMLGRHEKVHP